MKFNGNISRDLGLDYHSFSELKKEGKIVIRYTLSNKVTSEEEDLIGQYENLKLIKNGATYKYAPEIKYDVLYVSVDPEGENEEAVESFDDEYSKISKVDEANINSLLDEEIVGQFAMLTGAISMANGLALYYKQLQVEYPVNSEIFSQMADELIEQTNKLQGMINANEEKGDVSSVENKERDEEFSVLESFEDDPRMEEFTKIVYNKIRNNPNLSPEEIEEFIGELQVEDLGEMVGFYDEEGPDREETLSSKENMEKAADDYIAAVINNFREE